MDYNIQNVDKQKTYILLLTDYARIKNFIAPYVNAVTARTRGTQRMIAWWEGDTKREKKTNV